MSKIDTSIAFGFYIKDYKDFMQFQGFMKEKKACYKENWIFSCFDKKPNFMIKDPGIS